MNFNFNNLLMTVIYTFVGVILLFISYKIFDLLLTKIDFEEELKKGNIAVGILIGGIFIALAVIIHACLT